MIWGKAFIDGFVKSPALRGIMIWSSPSAAYRYCAPSPQSSPRQGEEVIRIPLSLEGEGQGEGEIEAYPAAHFVKQNCNQFSAPISKYASFRRICLRAMHEDRRAASEAFYCAV